MCVRVCVFVCVCECGRGGGGGWGGGGIGVGYPGPAKGGRDIKWGQSDYFSVLVLTVTRNDHSPRVGEGNVEELISILCVLLSV